MSEKSVRILLAGSVLHEYEETLVLGSIENVVNYSVSVMVM